MSATLELNQSDKVVGQSFPMFGKILRYDTTLCIWERHPVSGALRAVEALMKAENAVQLDTFAFDSASLSGELENVLGRDSFDVSEALGALVADFQTLAESFSQISGREHLRLRFERVEDDGCALFHVDTLSLRMLCTYAGPGTQWLEEDNVRRDELGARGRGIAEANAAIVIDSGKIQTAPAWHVLVFKGRLWKGHGFSEGLVHRSAPVRHPKDYRLRLTIDVSDSCTC